MLLSLEELCKSYGASLVLQDITAKIENNDRIGLIGANGAGKSTLLNIIYGELDADSGTVSRSNHTSFGFLRQNSGLSKNNSILEEMTSVFASLLDSEREMRKLEQQIAETGPAGQDYHELTQRYAHLQDLFERRDGYHINVKIETVLNGMGFAGVARDTLVNVLSGGEKTRLAICKLLLESPDLLILDEPTNHLDFKTLMWLEDYLQGYKGALLVVSHDRYFLNKLCTQIWDLEYHKLTAYNGNYSHYVVQKEERLERQRKEYRIQQEEIADLKDFVARNLVRASTTARAQSKRKTLEKMELVEKPKPPPPRAKISFTYKREPVKDILHVEDVSLSVGEGEERKQLCENIGFDLMRGEKIALIGANGIGKSSFLKAIQNLLPIDSGYIEWGKNTDISYFEQEDFAMDSQKTAIDELWDRFPREYEHTIRTVLGNVRLTGENVFKKVGELSGGERAKLKFAILILSCGNVLLMDEPTNHLDLSSKESLDAALRDYTGTLLVVSHDRYLLNQFPTKIAEMHSDRIHIYKGNYDAYLAQKATETTAPTAAEAQPKEPAPQQTEHYRSKKQRSEEQSQKRRIQELEIQIEELEIEIFRLEQEISTPEISSNYALLQEKCDILEDKRVDLNCRLSEWTNLCG